MRTFASLPLMACLMAVPLPCAAAGSALPAVLSNPEVQRAVPLPDFSYAGYGFGLREWQRPANATVVNVRDHGARGDDALDDSQAVLAALTAANKVKGPVVLRFPAGHFIISDILAIERSDFTLEGAGAGENGTVLHFPRPLRMVDHTTRLDTLRAYLIGENKRQVQPQLNIDLPFSPYSWTGGFIWVAAPSAESLPTQPVLSGERSAMTLQLEPKHGLSTGDIIRIEWFSRDGESSALLSEIYGPETKGIGKRHFEDPDRAIVVQPTRVLRVDGQRVWIADPLLHPIRSDVPARWQHWQGLHDVAIRDLGFEFPSGEAYGHHLEEGWNAVHFGDVFDGWIESLRIRDADSGVLTYDSASITLRDIRTEGERRAHYAVHLGSVHNALVTGSSVRNRVVHPLSFNTQSTRSVFQRATVWKDAVLDQHAGANHQNLFDAATLHIEAIAGDSGPRYALWDGSGAPYWQPGHGRWNTHWNLQVIVDSGADRSDTVLLTGLDEGPDARVVGLSGNRQFTIDYRPAPYVESLNQAIDVVPSLYDWQLAQRRKLADASGVAEDRP